MPSIINSSTSGGLITTGSTDGQLQLQTASTTALTISSGQVVSLTNALPVTSGGTGLTALGSANQVLGVNSGGTALAFSTPSAGAMTLLATVNATSGTYASFDGYFTSSYDVYLVTASNFVSSLGSTNLRSQIAIASSFKTDAYYRQTVLYFGNDANSTTVTGQSAADRIDMSLGGNIATNGGLCFYIYGPLDTNGSKVISYSLFGNGSDNYIRQNYGVASYTNSSAALSGIRFYPNSGTWSSGKFQLYGLKNS
jgi:hypothetical protein